VGTDGGEHATSFPYGDPKAPLDRPMVLAFHVQKTALTQTSFVIVPDDHVETISVNGAEVSLAEVDPKKLDDYLEGFRFPLGRYFKTGDNRVVVRVRNRGGPGGLDVRPDPKDWRNEVDLALTA